MVQIDDAIILLGIRAKVLIAKTGVQGQAGRDAVVVLQVIVVNVLTQIGLVEAGLDLGLLRLAQEQIGQG